MRAKNIYKKQLIQTVIMFLLTACGTGSNPAPSLNLDGHKNHKSPKGAQIEQMPVANLKGILTSCSNDTFNVLIIGDSISEGYTPFVQESLGREMYIQHNVTNYGYTNAETSGFTFNNLEDYLDDCPKWDVITFNNGAWDISQENGDGLPRGGDINQYSMNIARIAHRLEQTNANIVFFNMMPVETGDDNVLAHLVQPYSNAAFDTLAAYRVALYDFNSWAHKASKYQAYADVHYNAFGNKHNAQIVIKAIKENMN